MFNQKPNNTRLTPVTMGDAIIEPFWDPTLGVWQDWEILPKESQVKIEQTWCSIIITWKSVSKEEVVLHRTYADEGIPVGPYKQIVLSAAISKGMRLVLWTHTDTGTASQTFSCEVSHTAQYVLPLPEGTNCLKQVQISLNSLTGSCRLLWLGLRSLEVFKIEQDKWILFSNQPLNNYLHNENDLEEVWPLYNILCPADDFRQVQDTYYKDEKKWIDLKSTITLSPHLGIANENLFGRKWDYVDRISKTFYNAADHNYVGLLNAAQQAALSGNKKSMREVAKALVQISLIPHWDVDFITAFPGSSWEQRSFAQAKICYEIAVAFDLCGACLTTAGRAMILRRLAEEGIGNINYTVWSHPYIFNCNQLPVFSAGRLAVYAILEKQRSWGHVRPYTDLAFNELDESLCSIFLPDGSFPEGTAYFSYTLENAIPALAVYANARSKEARIVLPKILHKTDEYLEVFRSTEKPTCLILHCDAQGGPFTRISPSVLAVLAKLSPRGAAARLLKTVLKDQDKQMELWAYPMPDLSSVDPDYYETLIHLPCCGVVSSTRKVEGHLVKILAVGGPAKAGHNHEDRGSFVLEFAGETFAADPGGLSYSVVPYNMKFAQSHNMLVPIAERSDFRPAPKNPADASVIPEASGDTNSFHALMDAGILWPEYYHYWKRSIQSSTPENIDIIDEYELKTGTGVEFLWHTPLPVQQLDEKVIITGARGRVIITPQEGTAVEIIPHRDMGYRQISTIVFRQTEGKGKMITKIHLRVM